MWTAPYDGSVTGYYALLRRPKEGKGTLIVYVSDTGNTATTYTNTGTNLDTKLKPRWDVHLSGDDDQLGYAGEPLSSVLGE